MSFIPYLRKPPTHTQTGNMAPAADEKPELTVHADEKSPTATTDSAQDPFGPRQWHSNLVPLSGKNRALNEFSVERLGEETDQNLVMLHGKLHRSVAL